MSESDCIFCKIIANQIPSPRVYEDERFICIRDIRPRAKIHLLIVPRKHIASLDRAFPVDQAGETALMGELLGVSVKIAREQKLLPGGFRTEINTGRNGGQTVFHVHAHLMGGEQLEE